VSSTVVNDAAELPGCTFLVPLPHRRRQPQVLRHMSMVIGLLLVALASELKQFTAGIAKLTEDRPQ